ncbi:MAG: orotidine-5'-phosphate decarboxylase [Bacteroidales bacterium]|nr:orotidine-5'-phosphate decarboxylase [Bacteroidales bacterium]SKC53011.1 orotidine-5'-phosphate decarboxylase [Bacteroidales bacterium WCE2008]MBP5234617.1 orotidine-5'-phosphate decarboxylase [Bacteroidales bacterium]MBP5741417.1 orotidine-5'-phosphate decarboxylase [Bacteroidales bacterium]MBQ2109217.1 orotidine-5'-phosphate decarboxylase [Bacteroidales bacterium]
MNTDQLYAQIKAKGSMLCVGLDTDYSKLPEKIRLECQRGDLALQGRFYSGKARAIISFNKAIIDATAPYCVAYKPNLAFYEAFGSEGLSALEGTVSYIREKYPEQFIIADAKRGDIGNTAKMYAKTFFETMDFDAVTLSPYMGLETVEPFLQYPGKFAIVVALSSNKTAADFQYSQQDGKPLYQTVMEKCMEVSTPDNMMFVVGATKADKLREIRSFCPDNFLLVPGVGAQGGSAEEVIANGSNSKGGLLINSSRAVLYASDGPDYAEAAAKVAAATARLA